VVYLRDSGIEVVAVSEDAGVESIAQEMERAISESTSATDGSMTKWESYQEVATYLLNQFAIEFGLDRVEGRQDVVGKRSGTTWEIDAKGFRQGDSGFVIVECRRYTTSKQNQEKVGGLAYRIIDTGAEGGIIVSPLGLQEGAERVTAAENIVNVQLSEDSTQHEYVLRFLNKIMIGIHDTLNYKESVEFEVRDRHGNVVGRNRYES
jgi:hypothetical protein